LPSIQSDERDDKTVNSLMLDSIMTEQPLEYVAELVGIVSRVTTST